MFKTVPAEQYKDRINFSMATGRASQKSGPEALALEPLADLVQCIHELLRMGAGVWTMGTTPRLLASEGIPADRLTQLQTRFRTCPNLIQEVSRKTTPEAYRFEDGSSFYMLALVHDGILEGVLCLHGSPSEAEALSDKTMRTLAPLRARAAEAIMQVLEMEAGERSAAKAELVSDDNSSARAVVASRLLGNIAHDIRTPATVTRGYIRMLMDGRAGAITPQQQECLEFALKAANRLITLGATVEDAARAATTLTAEHMDLRHLWAAACRANQNKAISRSITIRSDDTPFQPVQVSGDRMAIASLLEQLLAQAIDESRGHSEMYVAISQDVNGPTLKIVLPLGASGNTANSNATAPFSELGKHFFIHGGTLLCSQKHGESATLTIFLPGRPA